MEKPAAPAVAPASRIDARVRLPELDLSKLERPADEGAKVDIFENQDSNEKKTDNAQGKPARPQAPPVGEPR